MLLLALRLALGRGSWLQLGLVAGIGLKTKYTLGVVLAILLLSFFVWRRDVLVVRGLALAALVATAVMIPNLVWEARHGWTSVHWFFHQGPSATGETRPQYVVNLLLLMHPLGAAVAIVGVRSLLRDRRVRPLGVTVIGVVLAYLVLGSKSYYAAPAVCFAIAAGAVALDAWLTAPRCAASGLPGRSPRSPSCRLHCPFCRSGRPIVSVWFPHEATIRTRWAGTRSHDRSAGWRRGVTSSWRRTTVRPAHSSPSAAGSRRSLQGT